MTQDDQQTPAPETAYSQADIAAQADSFGIKSWDVAGIFRQSGRTELTESEFQAELAIWKGEGSHQ